MPATAAKGECDQPLDFLRRELLPADILLEVNQIMTSDGQGQVVLNFHLGKVASYEVKRYYKAKSLT